MEDNTTAETFTDAEKRNANRVLKGTKLAQAGKTQKAAEVFRAILKTTPDEPDALHFYGIVLHQLGKKDKAMAAVRKSLSIAPDNAHALNSLGNFLKVREEFDEAAEVYQKALRLDPINAQCMNNLGTVLRNQGKHKEAVEILKEAVAINPQLAEAQYNLANLHFGMGDHWAALNAYRDCFKLGGSWRDPVFFAKLMVATDNQPQAIDMLVDFLKHNPKHEGAKFQLAAMRGDENVLVSEEYVADHFDKFASSFEGVLKGLEYRAPEFVTQSVIDRLGEPAADKEILDLGCGTGLCGPLIADYKNRMVGIDLSEGMLRQAAKLDCYDVLTVAELQQYLRNHARDSLDVIVCADTLVYLGALEKTMAGVRSALKPGGIFVASVEKLEGSDKDHILGIAGRFQHSGVYLERLAEENDLLIASIREEPLRTEGGDVVVGYIVEYMRPG